MEELNNMKPELLEYRVQRLEEAVLKLSDLAQIVTRWDERFSQQGGLMQCNLHTLRMTDVEKKLNEIAVIITDRTKAILLVDEHEDKIKALESGFVQVKSYMNKAVGALVILSIVIQMAGPLLVTLIKGHVKF